VSVWQKVIYSALQMEAKRKKCLLTCPLFLVSCPSDSLCACSCLRIHVESIVSESCIIRSPSRAHPDPHPPWLVPPRPESRLLLGGVLEKRAKNSRLRRRFTPYARRERGMGEGGGKGTGSRTGDQAAGSKKWIRQELNPRPYTC
jgi:hypothetical protein